jgi:hypothetical protein
MRRARGAPDGRPAGRASPLGSIFHPTARAPRATTTPHLDFARGPGYLGGVNRLIAYLRDHLIIDFQGDLTVEKVGELLAGDDSRETKALLSKVVAARTVDDMMLVLADCLLEPVQNALTDDFMREQLRSYTES